ncbi:MAG: helix-turn-helix transcriptional regulator [Acidobacteria bacterium]|nr:helix-turn-helix transcriptional regulator [Acidobacteriota bacterium]
MKTSFAYNEGWRRTHNQNGLITRLEGLEGLRIVWALNDPVDSGGWKSAQLRLIESLLPHVRQFVRVRQSLARADALSAGLTGLLDNSQIGVVHLDRGGRVLAANAPALDILRRGEGLSDRDGALHASVPADDGRLQRLLKRALPEFGSATPPAGGSLRIQRPRLRSRLELHVHPVEAGQADFGGRRVAALVLVVDPESRPRIDPVRLSMLLGLSPSEGVVSALLAEGRPVREIAAAAGFKESYVRWLLKQVYKKQGVSGQVALVQRVLTAYAFPRR